MNIYWNIRKTKSLIEDNDDKIARKMNSQMINDLFFHMSKGSVELHHNKISSEFSEASKFV